MPDPIPTLSDLAARLALLLAAYPSDRKEVAELLVALVTAAGREQGR